VLWIVILFGAGTFIPDPTWPKKFRSRMPNTVIKNTIFFSWKLHVDLGVAALQSLFLEYISYETLPVLVVRIYVTFRKIYWVSP
jgi:hypothetical protein